jgi:serine/threonine-protein kinase HipA
MNCPGCLKEGHETFCRPCRRRLFEGKKVAHVLTFTRPMYNQARLAATERLSISGIQTKMPLRLEGRQLTITESGGAYLLKPIPHGEFQRLDAVPANEHLTMQMARQVFGISVADNALVHFADGEPAYLVRRFDIQKDGTRCLQEDFAQIAQRSEELHGLNYKYDFSYEGIGDLIRRHVAAYQVEMEKFVRLVAFNYFVHNGDAHLKNFSLMRNDQYGDYVLTPAYDLLSTRLHVPHEPRTALTLFKDDLVTKSFEANGFYAYDDFHELAGRLGLHSARFGRMMRSFQERQDDVFSLIERSALSDESKELYKRGVQDAVKALTYSHTGLV